MPDPADRADLDPIETVLCIDEDVYLRLRRVLRHLCVGLVNLACGVRLLTAAAQAEALSLGPIQLLVHEALRWPFQKRRIRQVVNMLNPRPPSVVHAVSAGALPAASGVARAFDVDLVVQITKSADLTGAALHSDPSPSHYIAGSRPLLALLHDRIPESRNKTTLVRPGELAAGGATCFDEAERVPAILCTAPLEADAGIEVLLRACGMLRDKGHEFLLFLSGFGSHESALRRMVQKTQLAPMVTFARPEGDTSRIMDGADIFVQPHVQEALSAGPLQATAAGKVVVTLAGGIADMFRNGDTAVVVDHAGAAEFASAIERLLIDHSFARALAANAVAYLKEHHSVSVMAERTMDIYRALALRRKTFSLQR